MDQLQNFQTLPFAFRMINNLGRILGTWGLPYFSWNRERLMQKLQKRLSFVDWDSDSLVKNADRYLKKYDSDPHYSFFGKLSTQSQVHYGLSERMILEKAFSDHPEILHQPIPKPFFVIGLARSGTTLLQNLLIQDPDARWLRTWETCLPFPTSEGVWGTNADPRKNAHKKVLAKKRKQFPILNNIHDLDSPGECALLFMPEFITHIILLGAKIGRLQDWLQETSVNDWLGAYRFYRKYIQYLDWRQPGSHWVLKDIIHLTQIGNLLQVFPDARVIQIHRDPKETFPSTCNLMCNTQNLFRSDLDPIKLGRELLEVCVNFSQNNIAQRKAFPNSNILDIQYEDLVQKPLETLDRIYRHAGKEVMSQMGQNLNSWLKSHHGDNRPQKKYTMEQFGLTPQIINEAFKEYTDYFQISV